MRGQRSPLGRMPSLLFALWAVPFAFGQVNSTPQTSSYPSALPPGTILSEGELPIDLATALRLAGLQNPELSISRERITEAAALRQLAAAQILPNINAGTNFNLHRGTLQQANGNILKVNRDAMYVGLGAGAVGAGTVGIPGISYNLNVGTAWFNALRSRQGVARQVAASKSAEQDILLRVCLTYCELLRAEGRRAIATLNETEARELARLTDAYAQSKQGRQSDTNRANVELRKREAELVQAQGEIQTASARLGQLLSLDPTTILKPIDGSIVPAPIVPEPVTLAEAIAIALMQRPELAERRAEIQEALYALSSAKYLPFSPTVILGFSAGTLGGGSNLVVKGFVGGDGQLQKGPRFGDFDGRSDLDVAAYWTLQNLGVGNLAIVKAANSRLRQTNLRQIETMNRVRAEVAEAHAWVTARLAQIDSAAKAVQAGREAFQADLIRIRGREGLPIEVIDSMRLLGRSRGEYLDAIVEYNRAQFQLYVAMGQPPADRLARPVPTEAGSVQPGSNSLPTPLKP